MGIDYYAVLNVPRHSSLADIKLAYRKWAIATHPQRKPYPKHPENPPEGIPERYLKNPLPKLPKGTFWELVNEAYDVLSDPLRRQVYDTYGEEGLKSGVVAPNGYIQPYVYHNDYMKTFTDVIGTCSPYADLIDAVVNPPPLYTLANGATGVKYKEEDILKYIYLDLKEVFYGGVKKMKILRQEFVDESKTITKIMEKILTVPFPPGVLSGTRYKFVEEGDQGPTRIPADIVFMIADGPHEIFTRDGANLHITFDITLREALCGYTITIETIDERRIVFKLTDIITADYVKILNGEGLPLAENSNDKGDLHVHFRIEFPKYINRPEKLKLKQLFNEIYKTDKTMPKKQKKINKSQKNEKQE